MRTDVKADFEWQLRFLPTIRKIVGPLLLEPAPPHLDMTEATDMLVLLARDMRIGCRVRRHGYADQYPWDFTFRSSRTNGVKTELVKITEGWGDWLFYGHEDNPGSIEISRWLVIDLASWRHHMIWKNVPLGREIRNFDGRTSFRAYDVRDFPPEPPICIASSHTFNQVDFAALVKCAGSTEQNAFEF